MRVSGGHSVASHLMQRKYMPDDAIAWSLPSPALITTLTLVRWSQVWVKPDVRDGKLYWKADSDSVLTKVRASSGQLECCTEQSTRHSITPLTHQAAAV